MHRMGMILKPILHNRVKRMENLTNSIVQYEHMDIPCTKQMN